MRRMSLGLLSLAGLTPLAALADQYVTIHHGETVLNVDAQALGQYGISVVKASTDTTGDTQSRIVLQPFPDQNPMVIADDGVVIDGQVSHYWGLLFTNRAGRQFYAPDIVIAADYQPDASLPLQAVTTFVQYDREQSLLVVDATLVVSSKAFGSALEADGLVNKVIGTMQTQVFLAQSGDPLGSAGGAIESKNAADESVERGGCTPSTGPDVIVGDLQDIANYGAVGAIDAFSVGTTSCNIGSANVNWNSGTGSHPCLPPNIYRYKVVDGAGRFEQIGVGWMKHAFTALTGNLCCTCSGQGGSVLGVGCSDPYTAVRNGTQVTTVGGLGPRFQTNAHAGTNTYPYAFRNTTAGVGSNSIVRRCQVLLTDIDPGLNAGSLYYIEAQYVVDNDATNRNQNNNASYRQITISGAAGASNFNAALAGTTVRGKSAIKQWKVIDTAVVETEFETPEVANAGGDTTGFAILSSRAKEVPSAGSGVWRYEYALYNMNSDRSFSSFTVPVPASATVTNIGFHDVFYPFGDGYNSTTTTPTTYDGTDWLGAKVGAEVGWDMIPATPVENSNAIRWGITFNFRFDCNVPPAPVNGQAVVGMYKAVSGLADFVNVTATVPGLPPPPPCPGDVDGDRDVDLTDLSILLAHYGITAGQTRADGDLDGDGDVDLTDLSILLGAYGTTCP